MKAGKNRARYLESIALFTKRIRACLFKLTQVFKGNEELKVNGQRCAVHYDRCGVLQPSVHSRREPQSTSVEHAVVVVVVAVVSLQVAPGKVVAHLPMGMLENSFRSRQQVVVVAVVVVGGLLLLEEAPHHGPHQEELHGSHNHNHNLDHKAGRTTAGHKGLGRNRRLLVVAEGDSSSLVLAQHQPPAALAKGRSIHLRHSSSQGHNHPSHHPTRGTRSDGGTVLRSSRLRDGESRHRLPNRLRSDDAL